MKKTNLAFLTTMLTPAALLATPVQTVVLQDFESAAPTVTAVTSSNSSAGGASGSVTTVLAETGSNRLRMTDEDGGRNGIVLTIPGALPEPGHFLVTADIKVASTSGNGAINTFGMGAKVGSPSTAKVLDTQAGYVLNLPKNSTNAATFGYQTIGASVQVPAGGTFPKDLTLYFSTDPSGSPTDSHADFTGPHRGSGTSLSGSNSAAIYIDNIKRIGPGNFGEERHCWISVSSSDGLTNLTTLNNRITAAYNNGFNCIDVLVRYRTNRYYNNNRDYNTYPTSEPYVSGLSDAIDPIQFAIDRGHALGMRVYGSFSCFMTTDGSSYPSQWPSGSVTYTYNSASTPPTAQSGSGLWADVGRADVRNYAIHVAKDLVQNYDLDGVIFDRIRYDGKNYGYNPVALAEMGYPAGTWPAPTDATFMQKRRDAVTTFLHDAYEAITDIKPWMIVGTVPIAYGAGLQDTYNDVFQSWPDWSAASTANRAVSFGAQDLIQPQFYRMWNSTNYEAPETNRTLMNYAAFGHISAMAMDFGLMPGSNTNFAPLFYAQTITSEADAANTAQALAHNICDTQSGSYFTNGNGLYNATPVLDAIQGASVISRIHSATTACGGDVMSFPAPVKSDFLMKEGYDNTPPNPVTVTVNNQSSLLTLNWATPAPAADGEIPSRYLIYRSTSANVLPYYSNQLAVTETVTGNSFTDGPFPAGITYYYRVVAVDDYNNKSTSSAVGPYTVTAAPGVIVESRNSSGNLTASPAYSESVAMANTTSKSSASGLTGDGSRYSANVNMVATFRPNLSTAGKYNVYVTLDDNVSGSNNNALAEYTITGTGAPVVGQVRLVGTDSSLANNWLLLESNVNFAAGNTGSIAFKNLDGNSGTGKRFVMDAVKFILVGSAVDDWQLY